MAKNQFGGFGGGNMQQLMRQAQKMQEQLAKTQEQLEQKEYEATAGGGMVTCKVTGKYRVVSLIIKPEAVDPEDVDMLQDLVTAAVNEAVRMAQEDHEKAMGAMAPGGMGGLL